MYKIEKFTKKIETSWGEVHYVTEHEFEYMSIAHQLRQLELITDFDYVFAQYIVMKDGWKRID